MTPVLLLPFCPTARSKGWREFDGPAPVQSWSCSRRGVGRQGAAHKVLMIGLLRLVVMLSLCGVCVVVKGHTTRGTLFCPDWGCARVKPSGLWIPRAAVSSRTRRSAQCPTSGRHSRHGNGIPDTYGILLPHRSPPTWLTHSSGKGAAANGKRHMSASQMVGAAGSAGVVQSPGGVGDANAAVQMKGARGQPALTQQHSMGAGAGRTTVPVSADVDESSSPIGQSAGRPGSVVSILSLYGSFGVLFQSLSRSLFVSGLFLSLPIRGSPLPPSLPPLSLVTSREYLPALRPPLAFSRLGAVSIPHVLTVLGSDSRKAWKLRVTHALCVLEDRGIKCGVEHFLVWELCVLCVFVLTAAPWCAREDLRSDPNFLRPLGPARCDYW